MISMDNQTNKKKDQLLQNIETIDNYHDNHNVSAPIVNQKMTAIPQ